MVLKAAAIKVSAIHFYCKFSLKSMSSKRIGALETYGPVGSGIDMTSMFNC